MTMRVKLEIVPFGDESKAYEIGRLDIFNNGRQEGYEGPVDMKMYKYGVIDLGSKPGLYDCGVVHHRPEGAWKLVKQVLTELDLPSEK